MRRTGGSILIVSLWILTIFVLLVLSLGYRSHLEATISLREKESFEVAHALFSALDIAQYYINADEEPTIDSTLDRWYNQLEISEDVWPHNNLSISIIDEESKLNINQASEAQLTALFEYVDREVSSLQTPLEDLVSAILYWRGEASVKGKKGLKTDYKEAPFQSLQELLLIDDIRDADYVRLKQYLTVYQANENIITVNVNTASPAVIRALIFGLAGDIRHKEDLFDGIVALRAAAVTLEGVTGEDESEPFLRGEDLSPYKLLKRIDVTSDVVSVSLAIQFLRHCTVDSQIFFVTASAGAVGKPQMREIEAVLSTQRENEVSAGAGERLMVVAWHEKR